MPTHTTTGPAKESLDDYGVERTRQDEPAALEKYREKWPWFDHVMRMQERYTDQGGNQFAAGITYFSVLSMFPLLMLVLAITLMVLAGNQEMMDSVTEKISSMGEGGMGDTVNSIVEQATEQAGSIFSIGLLLALWTGLSWIGNLRMGASSMWKVSGTADNFIKGKLSDLIVLIGLLIALIVAFAVTTIGNSGLTLHLLDLVGLQDIPGIRYITFGVALVVGLLANFVVFTWMLGSLPRVKTHRKSVFKAAVIGAVAFEVFKQFATMFFSNALSNPAGAAFGPIIGLMVLMYFIWRITLYCSAWAATTPESLALLPPAVPSAAVIRVRQEVRTGSNDSVRAGLVGSGAAIGVLMGGALGMLLGGRKK
ncbi:inner membrane protein YhjD [Corynebacterium sp. 320]|uniref:YhjD/YihY/BrkB family envelope integrity protein n=1 Tax=Corynebacterium TaxID=1716 RepID=UPI00125CCB8E|nr:MULTISPECIES: YhjD/YihY/BrkB family envelope integrity protein [Corynebacterium]KAB1504215.1 inner membrane protein YhjD [Corynebacterium sp. 320]KAB1552685.1 inner membrane protein YhjD [Corynebacterium sp. 321]KAB1554097.1 inner membrane protein YhjD [Corynebacterium sp. 319]KAB3528351.1 inner membrane protein YhjD [Corynebacterium sp. 250]KAB3540160.1 inner membrane protein YhjD [Corynebacterium sp. 366]